MSTSAQKTQAGFVADSLAVGIVVMLAMNIVQRGLGFVRGIWFCRELDDAVVGQWSLAYDFLVMITPIMLLGLPGVLPRYVEYFRRRGCLRPMIKRLSSGTLALTIAFCAALLMTADWFAWMLFASYESVHLIYALTLAVALVVVFNFVKELAGSLRQVRLVSVMQFVQSVAFTLIAVISLAFGGSLVSLIHSFSTATFLATVPGLLALTSGWKEVPAAHETFDAGSMWRKILPFAFAVWSMNLLCNAFAFSDRYMILHWLPEGPLDAAAAVGQYHSGRLFPMLLMSVATMIGGTILPYLSADWEANRRPFVRLRMSQILLAISALFTVGAAVIMLFSPWIFAVLLENRYQLGLTLMPMAFVFSIWVSLAVIAENYLWVVERGKWVAIATGIGLAANIGLNSILLPRWGLEGAVFATLVANLVVLVGVLLAMNYHGYSLDRITFYSTILPATLLAGPWAAIISVVACWSINPDIRHWTQQGLAAANAKWCARFS